MLNVKQESWECQFYSVCFDPTENRIRVNRFCSRRSIHLTTDRLSYGNKHMFCCKSFASHPFLGHCPHKTLDLLLAEKKNKLLRNILHKFCRSLICFDKCIIRFPNKKFGFWKWKTLVYESRKLHCQIP